MKSLAIIPARFASTRFPGKPLALLGGKPLLRHVWENTQQAKLLDHTIIATDHPEIFNAAKSWGAEVHLTKADHLTGTDRCAEVAESYAGHDIIINVQGDEPFLNPKDIDLLIHHLRAHPQIGIATLCTRIQNAAAINDPHVVKVVKTGDRAQYFSRATVPHARDISDAQELVALGYNQHIGVYAFRSDVLKKVAVLPEGNWESIERLEQLRWLEAGHEIAIIEVEEKSMGIDTPEDLARAEAFLKKG